MDVSNTIIVKYSIISGVKLLYKEINLEFSFF